jgi:hypothetical protein
MLKQTHRGWWGMALRQLISLEFISLFKQTNNTWPTRHRSRCPSVSGVEYPPRSPAPSARMSSSSGVAPPVISDRINVSAFWLKYVWRKTKTKLFELNWKNSWKIIIVILSLLYVIIKFLSVSLRFFAFCWYLVRSPINFFCRFPSMDCLYFGLSCGFFF